jgi:chromosome segregation ATPase
MVLAVLGLIVNVSELVGIWAAYGPARSAVTDVSNTLTQALQAVDNGLVRVNDRVQTARQSLTQVNADATQLGDRVQTSSPLITALSQRVDNELAPRIENARTTAVSIHDAVVKVNSALVALNRFPGVTVPTLSDQLGTVSDRAQEAQAAAQDLRVTLANIKAGLVTKAESAVMQVTSRIDAPLARIQALVNTYQAKATQAQERVTSTTNSILTLLLVTAVALTLFLIIFMVGLVLLIYVCWQYVRTGRFPSLRVVRT